MATELARGRTEKLRMLSIDHINHNPWVGPDIKYRSKFYMNMQEIKCQGPPPFHGFIRRVRLQANAANYRDHLLEHWIPNAVDH